MTLRLRQRFLLVLLLTLADTVIAGPNWNAIEEARAARQEQKQVVEKQETIHESALQKLKVACEKVKDNAELANACREIIAADAEINSNH